MMEHLSPEARALFDAARRELGSTQDERARLLARIERQIHPPPANVARITRAATVLLALGGMVALLLRVASIEDARIATPATETLRTEVAPSLRAVELAQIVERSESPSTATNVQAQPAPPITTPRAPITPRSRIHQSASHSGEPQPQQEVVPSTPQIVTEVEAEPDEIMLLREAHQMHRAGSHSLALALLAEHGSRYPASTFTNERTALRLIAQCALGERDEALAFVAAAPNSPYSSRIARACTTP
jgi:hypothetical protein